MASPKKLIVLRRRAEFLAAAKSGKKYVTPGFVLQLGSTREDGPRYGLTATTKIGNAVVRNRARRRLRALAFDILAAHAAPRDYVLIARDGTGSRDYGEMKKDLEAALKKFGAWHE